MFRVMVVPRPHEVRVVEVERIVVPPPPPAPLFTLPLWRWVLEVKRK